MSDRTNDEKSIFLHAVEITSPIDLEAYLSDACGDNRGLRRQVQALLDAYRGPFRLLDAADHMTPAVDPDPPEERIGESIGPYRLLEAIGEGGMGVVYMAEQERPVRRKVALKLIKPGMDSRQIIARFEVERQALAMMDHPNIARVHDAGATPDGRPYFVMELVHGLPITEYCDREQLAIPERLELFVLVCRAVQHAHQKGVIHRDLKPSNVLVTVVDGAAVPKVIDFGIAKAVDQKLTDKTCFTAFAQLVGTPLYMSPEQAALSGVDVDTRGDVYSLGVLLYELLTGTTPFEPQRFQKAAFDEMRRIIREEEPPTPSSRLNSLSETAATVSSRRSSDPRRLNRAVRGELDWIVMKALEKDRKRRYETANDLAADVMRHLSDQPVEAKPTSAWYRFTKSARRHRVALTTTSLVAAALIMGAGVSVWQAIRATRAERVAEARYEESRQVVDDMYTQVAEKWMASQSRMTTLQREFLDKALGFYKRVAAERADDPAARIDAARAQLRVARIHEALGAFEQAEAAYRGALGLLDALLVEHPGRDDGRERLGLACGMLAEHLAKSGRYHEAEELFDRAIALYRELSDRHPGERSHRIRSTMGLLGKASVLEKHNEDAESVLLRARDILQPLLKETPDDFEVRVTLGGVESKLGELYGRSKRFDEAERAYRRSTELHAPSGGPEDAANPDLQRRLAEALVGQAYMLGSLGRRDEMFAINRKAEELLEALVREHPDEHAYRGQLLLYYFSMVQNLTRNEDVERFALRGLELGQSLTKESPSVPLYQTCRLLFLGKLGMISMADQPAKARAYFEQSFTIADGLVREFPDAADFQRDLSQVCASLANCYSVGPPDDPLYNPGRAEDLARRSLELAPGEHAFRNSLARAQYRLGKLDEFFKTMEIVNANAPSDRLDDFFLAMAHWRMGRKTEALASFKTADASFAEQPNPPKDDQVPHHRSWIRVRAEAAAMLGLNLSEAPTRPEPMTEAKRPAP